MEDQIGSIYVLIFFLHQRVISRLRFLAKFLEVFQELERGLSDERSEEFRSSLKNF